MRAAEIVLQIPMYVLLEVRKNMYQICVPTIVIQYTLGMLFCQITMIIKDSVTFAFGWGL